MAETLLAWFTHYADDPKGVEARVKGRPVLLYEPPQVPEGADEEYQIRTQSGISMPAIGGGDPMAAVVEKNKENAFQRRVTIGRTLNNDVVLEDASVSRFHAWIEEAAGVWQLADAGSRNGTHLGGRRLEARKPAALTSGARIRVGAVELTFYSAEAFLKLLKQRFEHG